MMDKSEIRTSRVDSDNKQLKGLKNEGIIEFECADCGELLLCLQLTSIKENIKAPIMVLTRVVVKCGLCGGCSYVKQVSGQFYPGAPSDDMAFDVFDNNTDAPQADVLFRAWKK